MTELLTLDDQTAQSLQLPLLSGAAREHGAEVKAALLDLLKQKPVTQAYMPFEDYMQFCLYQTGLGYYSSGLTIFDESGDFITSPSMGKLFATSLAEAIAPTLAAFDGHIVEFGAGNGALAVALVEALVARGCEIKQYTIIELSPALMQRQQQVVAEKLPTQQTVFVWQDSLPANNDLSAVVIANEVLDAMPHCRFKMVDGSPKLLSVVANDNELSLDFCETLSPQQSELLAPWLAYWQEDNIVLPQDLESEYSPYMPGWLSAIEQSLDTGMVFLVDYGSVAREFYLPQRLGGTFICHYKHFAHEQALLYPGMQDLSASVDFTAVAHFGLAAGFELIGVTTQAAFLTSVGMLDDVAKQQKQQQTDNKLSEEYRLLQETKRLLMPGEMGERFKVMLLGKNISDDIYEQISGFSHQEISDQL